MEKIKTNLDRKQLSSDYIRSKQDFANVVKGAKGLGKPYWQTNWFYGTVGVTAVAIIVTAVTLSSSDTPAEEPDNNNMVVMTSADDQKENPIVEESEETNDSEKEVVISDSPEESNEETSAQNTSSSEEETSSQQTSQNTTEETSNNTAARTAPDKEEEVVEVEVGLPNVAGVSGGPISFRDFCDPLGIQVDGGVLIHQYTIQYRSCARDITARIRGNRLPSQVCEEIRDCGTPIEVTFSNFKAEDRNGNPVQLKEFSLTTRP